jgi:hypothetical protein
MNIQKSNLVAALLLAFMLLGSMAASAASHPFEFHADARMQHERFGPIDQAYGYMNVMTDANGNGSITVMFSNGSGLDLEQFNARVKFLDTAGAIIKEEYFDCWMDAEGLREAIECKVTKPVSLSSFESVEVDFYLSDIDDSNATALVY